MLRYFRVLDFAESLVDYLSYMFGATRTVTIIALIIFFAAHAFLWWLWSAFFNSIKWLITG